MKRKKRKRTPKHDELSETFYYNVTLIKGDIEMLDGVLKEADCLRSDYEDRWIEGFRQGMALALDLCQSRIEDVAIRGTFEGHPIRVRYKAGSERTITDDSLLHPRTVVD